MDQLQLLQPEQDPEYRMMKNIVDVFNVRRFHLLILSCFVMFIYKRSKKIKLYLTVFISELRSFKV